MGSIEESMCLNCVGHLLLSSTGWSQVCLGWAVPSWAMDINEVEGGLGEWRRTTVGAVHNDRVGREDASSEPESDPDSWEHLNASNSARRATSSRQSFSNSAEGGGRAPGLLVVGEGLTGEPAAP